VKEEDKEDKDEVVTDLGDESDQSFDYNKESDFNNNVNGDEDKANENIE
jgi:hypothetical protein